MQKQHAKPLGDILEEFMNQNIGLKTQLAEHRAVRAWRSLLGEGVSAYTRKIYFQRGVLYVQLSSSVLRAELQMNKQNLIEKINEAAQLNVVKDIILR